MALPYDQQLQYPESLLEWADELEVVVDLRELDRYPQRPLIFSEYRLAGPTIVVYRYLPMEDWLNYVCQQQVGFYGPWYYLHVSHRLYYHLELHGLYAIERKWYHHLLGQLTTTDERAYAFTRQILGTRYSPARFDDQVDRFFQPANIKSF